MKQVGMLRAALVAALLGVPVAASADVAVEGAFARATAGAGKVGAAYMTLKNDGTAEDVLVSAASPVAARAELHTHVTEGEIKRMREVESIPLPPGATVALEPGGLHIMLIDLKAPLKEGESFPLTLTFAEAGAKTVTVMVQAPAAMTPMSHGHEAHGQPK